LPGEVVHRLHPGAVLYFCGIEADAIVRNNQFEFISDPLKL
jgi:hypothetical protein